MCLMRASLHATPATPPLSLQHPSSSPQSGGHRVGAVCMNAVSDAPHMQLRNKEYALLQANPNPQC